MWWAAQALKKKLNINEKQVKSKSIDESQLQKPRVGGIGL